MRSPDPTQRRAWPALLGAALALGSYGALVAALTPAAASFDGLASVLGAREGTGDFGHALYRPLLRLVLHLGGGDDLVAARLLSAVGAVLAAALLGWHLVRTGVPRLQAALVTALFALAPLLWQEAGSIEPTTWALAALLGAAAAAEACARAPGTARVALLLALFLVALGFHLAALFALPWLLALARPRAAGSARALALGGSVAGVLVLALALASGRLGEHLVYWWGFVPDLGDVPLRAHARRGASLLWDGAPVLSVAALAARLLAGRRARPGPELWLGGAYALAFLALGKPLVGLGVPFLLALALALGRVAAGVPPARAGRATLALGLAAALQLGLSLPQALAWHQGEDSGRRRAERLAQALPAGTRLLAGGLAQHLRYYHPGLDVLALPELWHRTQARQRDADPLAVVAAARAQAGKPCALSSDAVAFLVSLGADPARLGLTLERARLFPEDPELALFPLEAGAGAARYDAPMLAAAPPQEPAAPPALVLALERAPFDGQGRNAARLGEAFTLLLADADLDGDPDVLVNWHLFAPLELWWNEGGRFLRRPEGRAWSLPDHAAVPLLEGAREAMLAALAQETRSGVYAWHSDAKPFWFFAPTRALPAGARLEIETNRPLAVHGLEPGQYELRAERFLTVPLAPELAGRWFFLATQEAAIQLKARLVGATAPFFVGAERSEVAGPLDLWYRDPHGLAWLDVAGGPAPDVYVTRGALRGHLAPPFDPKHDDFFVAGAEPGAFTRVEMPGDHGRGRAVQWVDVDADGTLELYASAKEGANRLLVFDAQHASARDVAPERGLDFAGADSCAWLDLDGDGDEDLITLDARAGLGCVRSEGGRHFARAPELAPGLRLAPLAPQGEETDEQEETTRGIDEHDLALFDLENDGDLDLLVTGWGPTGACLLFRAEGRDFVEATAAAGLGAATGTSQAVLADLDADGFLDVLCLGKEPRLFHNARGALQPLALPVEWAAAGLRVGASGDVDGDGRSDLVLAGRQLWLARNRGTPAGPWVELSVTRAGRVPVGARVRAQYADGTVHAARIGSTHGGHLSQSHGPLRLASPSRNPLRAIEVLFPGGVTRRVELAGPGPISIDGD